MSGIIENSPHGERDPGGFRPRILPPVWAGIIGFAMLIVDRTLELQDAVQLSANVAAALRWPGIAVLVAGTGLSAWAAWGFAAASTPIEPGRVSTTLLVGGPYRFSRNPIYLGMAIGLVGWAMFLAQPVVLLGPATFVVIITRRIVRHEERMLAERFGHEYATLCDRVGRWI
jgi:protein-S-isoprenylcysteine O-methyltransferase Ste14